LPKKQNRFFSAHGNRLPISQLKADKYVEKLNCQHFSLNEKNRFHAEFAENFIIAITYFVNKNKKGDFSDVFDKI